MLPSSVECVLICVVSIPAALALDYMPTRIVSIPLLAVVVALDEIKLLYLPHQRLFHCHGAVARAGALAVGIVGVANHLAIWIFLLHSAIIIIIVLTYHTAARIYNIFYFFAVVLILGCAFCSIHKVIYLFIRLQPNLVT